MHRLCVPPPQHRAERRRRKGVGGLPYPELKPGYGKLDGRWADAVCQLDCRYGSVGSGIARRIGTGFLVGRSKDTAFVATAAHLLYNHGAGGVPAQRITLSFGRNRDQSERELTMNKGVAARCRLPDAFRKQGDRASAFDYGVICVPDPLDGIAVIALSPALPHDERVRIVGYPCEESAGTAPYHALLELDEAGSELLDYVSQVTYEGMSGAPLLGLHERDGMLHAHGLHVTGVKRRRAVRFSAEVRENMKRWMA